jgi:flagellar FliJ protein
MGFKFRYETLLSYRQHIKEKAEIDFAQALQQLRLCRGGLEDLNNRRKMVTARIESDLKGKVSSHELKNYSKFMDALQNRIIAQEMNVAKWEEVVRKKIEILLEKAKQHKVIEKLKEKDLGKWKQHQNFLEQKIMNETAIIRHGRKPV